MDQFLTGLTEAGVRYAVLRWFETLPDVEADEDIDLLVADEDLAVVESRLTPYPPFPPTQKVDLYSESGTRGTDFSGVPYLSGKLARRVLEGAVLHKGKYRVPSPVDHLDSMAFHAVYHKGAASGLPRTADDPVAPPPVVDHDYRSTIERLARAASREVQSTLHGLDRYLTAQGLRPATDTLERFQARNPWLREQLSASRKDIGPLAGLIVFVVREAAVQHEPEIVRAIERYGFEVLRQIPLSEEQRPRVADAVRGGNWGRGPFPRSGGGPASLICAYDFSFQPEEAPDGQIVNPKAVRAKYAVRDLIAERLHRSKRFNPMHSSDNGWQSIECLEAVRDGALLADLEERIADIERQVRPQWPVERFLSSDGKRARVAIVDHPEHGRAVLKIFRPGSRRFLDREIAARREFADSPVVSPLLEHGENWLLSPLFEDDRSHVRRPLPGTGEVQLTDAAVRRLLEFTQSLREKGFFLLDLGSHNVLSDPRKGLLVLDFEFLQRYEGPLPAWGRDFTVTGNADGNDVDQPVYASSQRWDLEVHKTVFHPAVAGLRVDELRSTMATPFLRAKMALLQWSWFALFAAWAGLLPLRRARLVRALVTRMRRR